MLRKIGGGDSGHFSAIRSQKFKVLFVESDLNPGRKKKLDGVARKWASFARIDSLPHPSASRSTGALTSSFHTIVLVPRSLKVLHRHLVASIVARYTYTSPRERIRAELACVRA